MNHDISYPFPISAPIPANFIENQNRISHKGLTVTQKKFDENAWKNWQKALELRITDRSIGLFHQGVEILYHNSNADNPLMKHELNNNPIYLLFKI